MRWQVLLQFLTCLYVCNCGLNTRHFISTKYFLTEYINNYFTTKLLMSQQLILKNTSRSAVKFLLFKILCTLLFLKKTSRNRLANKDWNTFWAWDEVTRQNFYALTAEIHLNSLYMTTNARLLLYITHSMYVCVHATAWVRVGLTMYTLLLSTVMFASNTICYLFFVLCELCMVQYIEHFSWIFCSLIVANNGVTRWQQYNSRC